jgi:hypothetical protein
MGAEGKGPELMLEVLQFIFRDFWTWLGTLILLAVVAEGLGGVVRRK